MPKIATVSLFTDRTTTGNSDSHQPWNNNMSFHAYGSTTAGAGAATINIYVSNDNVDFSTLAGIIPLTLSTSVSGDGFVSLGSWRYVRANVSAISGTGAKVSVIMGVEIP